MTELKWPLIPGDVSTGESDRIERPTLAQPLADVAETSLVQVESVIAQPEVNLAIILVEAGRLDVQTADASLRINRQQ